MRRRILTALDLPPAWRQALYTRTPERDLPLKQPHIESLSEYLRENFTDPRRANRSFPCWSLLALVAMALFAGRNTLSAIQRYGQFLTQNQRRWLGFPCKPGTLFRKAPSYSALRNLLTQIDPQTRWPSASTGGSRPTSAPSPAPWPSTANGSRDRALSLCLSDHETRAPVALGFAREKTRSDEAQSQDDFKREGEQTVALRLYATTNLENPTVAGDALNNNKPQARAVLAAGGDYFLQPKNENRHA